MKKILVTFATTATLLLASNVFADDAAQNESQENAVQTQEVAEQQTKTITENLQELKDNLKNFAEIGSDKFNQTLSDTYNQMSQTIADIKVNAKEQKDKSSEKLQKALENINVKMEEYKKAGSEKQEKLRQAIIDKLEDLNKKIDEHNKDKANAQ